MNKILVVLLLALMATLIPGAARAAEAPVTVSHEITGYVQGGDQSSIDYLLHITNPGEQPLSDLVLTVLPSRHSLKKRVVLNVGSLDPNQSTDLSLHVETDRARGENAAAREPLLIAGKCLDAQGKILSFPVTSRSGGAR